MLLHRFTLCPNGHFVNIRKDLNTFAISAIEKYAAFFTTTDRLSASGAVTTAPDITFEWLGTPFGQAKLECRYRGRLVLRDALVLGRDAKLDQAALRVLARDLAGEQVLEQPSEEWPSLLRELVNCPDRPLLVGALWQDIPLDEVEKLTTLNLLLSAVYLRHLDEVPPQRS